MKVVLVAGAFVSAFALSACGMLGGEGPAPDTLAAKAPAALPPPASAPAAVAAPATAAPPPQPEDLKPIPADQVKCIPPYVLKTTEKNGEIDARCVAPSEVSGTPK